MKPADALGSSERLGPMKTAQASESMIADLAGALSTPILREHAALEPFARDFSGLHTEFPLAVVRASTEEEVVSTFRTAARHGMGVTIRGAGHSCNGQTLTEGGLVLSNFEPGGEMTLDPADGSVSVPARSSWYDLQEYLVSQGRSCPVLTDYLYLSVGGTLSVGGYGARSIANGAQIDNVERLKLVLPSGRVHWCSPHENFELFRLALAGQGAVGCIERVVLRTMARCSRTRIYGFEQHGLEDLASSLGWLETWNGPTPDWFIGAQRFRPGPGFTVAQFGFDLGRNRPLDALPLTPLASRKPSWVHVFERAEIMTHQRTVDLVDGHPDCVRLWADYVFGYSSFVEFARYVEQRLREERFRTHLSVIGLLIHRSPASKIDFPFEASASALGRYKYMVGFYFFVPAAEHDEIEHVRTVLSGLLIRCLELGGRPYRYGVAELDAAQKNAVLGSTAADVSKILLQHDAS